MTKARKKVKSRTIQGIDWDIWKPRLIRVLIVTVLVTTCILLFLITMGKSTGFTKNIAAFNGGS